LPLPFGGWCIDTPGIKSFGVWELQEQDLRGYFGEIQEASRDCKFPDCRHQEEPGCAIPKAIEDGKISILRYASYLSLLESIKKEHLRR
jgi:ribosome biogenesis GTPase